MKYIVDKHVEVAVHNGQTGRGCSTQWTDRKRLQYTMDRQEEVAVHNGHTGRGCSTQWTDR